MGYFLSKDFQNSGPYDIGSLQGMVKSGKIGEGHWACKEGTESWVEVTTMPELKSAFTAQSKPEAAKPAPVPKSKPASKKK
jgi:hypothetical protein